MTSSVSPALWEDLRTDWIPDALGGAFLSTCTPPDEAAETVAVPTASGLKVVPLPTVEMRAWAAEYCDPFMSSQEGLLDVRVFGYRDAITPYRKSHALFRQELAELAAGDYYVAHVDVEDFYRSVTPDRLDFPSQVRIVLRHAENHYGTPLLSGHRWSRRLANLVLRPGDEALGDQNFIRWQDDYWIAGADLASLERSLQVLESALSRLNLRLNTVKTEVSAPGSAKKPDLWERRTTQDHVEQLRQGTSVPSMKNALRHLLTEDIREVDYLLPGLVASNPHLAPRAAYYVAVGRARPSAVDCLLEMLKSEDEWVFSRMLAASSAYPGLARRLPTDIVARAASSRLTLIRSLAARIQWMREEPRTRSFARVDRAFRDRPSSALLKAQPQLDSTL